MDIEITGRHARITQEVQDYARSKAEKVGKYLRADARIEVVLDYGHDRYQAEMIVSGHRGPIIVASLSHEDASAAVDLTIDKIVEQLRRMKERRKSHRGESMAGELRSPNAPEVWEDGSSEDLDGEELKP